MEYPIPVDKALDNTIIDFKGHNKPIIDRQTLGGY